MHLRPFYLLIFCMLTQTSFSQDTSNIPKDNDFFDPYVLGRINKQRNLKISARFNECGEWGGHKEEITVSADENSIFYANYKVFAYNCDTAYNVGIDNNEKLLKDTIILIDKTKKEAIKKYIYELVESKISERIPTPNVYFSISNSDSSFVIIARNKKAFNSYLKFVNDLRK